MEGGRDTSNAGTTVKSSRTRPSNVFIITGSTNSVILLCMVMSTGKASGKSTCQLLFLKAILQPQSMASSQTVTGTGDANTSQGTCSDMAMKLNLKEIASFGYRLEAMDTKIVDFSMDSKSIQRDIAGFQDRVTDLDHRLTDVDGRLSDMPDKDHELQFL
ncbi:hypothetical protein NDU88_006189 [Pleurodeles waltl]|uniref:Uncharacterized protein n=1 Tax=Pleurodeles waltl TaxID=8319 RepID=A0AAV7VQP1_PLEWA|nr:hypothetical protein NDU88_006189 [Pleurodeles waltl]